MTTYAPILYPSGVHPVIEDFAVPFEEVDSVPGSASLENQEAAAPCPASASGSHELPNAPAVYQLEQQLEHDQERLEAAVGGVQAEVWGGQRYRSPTVEEFPEAGDDLDNEQGVSENVAAEESEEDWDFEGSSSSEDEYEAISVWDKLAESLVREGLVTLEDLTEEELQFLRPFALKVGSHMSSATFAKLALAFPDSNVSTWATIQSRITKLSGFEPQLYHCCVNSCCAFTGPHADKDSCSYCNQPRYDSKHRPRKLFVYLPLIPRLKSFLANQAMARRMQYRAAEHVHAPGIIKDVMDAETYRALLKKFVTVDGKTLAHKFFEDDRDVALGLSTDGFAPFKRRTNTAWPLIVFNYNLPPEVRFHLDNILCLGVIPGPKKPADFNSFLWPFIQEMLRLAVGIHTYDVLSDEFFALRAYLILVFGDIPAISMVMRMKGHNGSTPCRMCEIHSIRPPDTRAPASYVPLDRSCHPHVANDPLAIRTYDPANLPLRSHTTFLEQAREVQYATTKVESERLAKQYGIKGTSALSVLSSLTFPDSFPYDFMHLLWENVVKNLMSFWTGTYKGLDQGIGSYQLPSAIWEEIGAASAASGDSIPYVFGPRPPNVASDKTKWTADTRSFWILYVAPVLLQGRFVQNKYYDHFIDLVKLLHTCLQFEITDNELDLVKQGFIKWVKKYEDYYYQHDASRLSVCPLTIHALLHIADSIRLAGPVWASWAYPMERYCGLLGPSIRSRRHPYASLNRYVLDSARLDHIKLLYQAHEVLSLRKPPVKEAVSIPGYPTCVVLPACKVLVPDRGLIDKIVSALCTRYAATPAAIRTALPLEVQQWGKLRILNDGDTIRAAELVAEAEDGRDASFIRVRIQSCSSLSRPVTIHPLTYHVIKYELLVDKNARYRQRPVILEQKTFYGQLRHILVIKLGPVPSASPPQLHPSTLMLGAVRRCVIESDHHDLDIHYYKRFGALEIIDISTIQCLVGRVQDRGRFAIIDRSGSLARAIYVQD
ncbi:hypothetical protein TRAPUB_690 [Trametes pubescens]|uniref:Transposase domain-containing protein n=1 Tax=Trametes pubescens TaxID=154538 RepID=A0A1M2VLJ2_TRAPU|nr:hypothetical protein TRAPUB_690 [Trametes pubescens]